jgi:hypothetical protein
MKLWILPLSLALILGACVAPGAWAGDNSQAMLALHVATVPGNVAELMAKSEALAFDRKKVLERLLVVGLAVSRQG